MEESERWTTIYERTQEYYDSIKQHGGQVEVVSTPDVGFKGDSHLMMLEKNNLEIADYITAWLKKHHLYKG